MTRALVVVVAIALGASCAPDDRNYGPYPKENAGDAVKPSDPRAEGQWYFFHETWGTEVLGEWPPADFMLSLMSDEPALFGNQYAAFGFLPDADDDFPIGFKRGTADKTRVHETCGLCHVAALPDGTRWLGIPNTHLDFGRFRAEVNDRWVAAGHAPLVASPRDLDKLRATGPGRSDASTSDIKMAIPVAFPSHLTLGTVTALNYLGTSSNVKSEASLSIFIAFGAGTHDVPFPSGGKLDAFLDFFGALPPPPPPEADVDAALAKRGRAVFHEARCDACHHLDHVGDAVIPTPAHDLRDRLPGDDDRFPAGTIGTDRGHRIVYDGPSQEDRAPEASDGGGYLDADLIGFIVSHGLSLGPSDGYRVSDLRGLAFTAPYLHNDSVPTLEDLLRHAEDRPVTFERDGFVIDTRKRGNSNQGHELGVDLGNEDQAALVAFLKTL